MLVWFSFIKRDVSLLIKDTENGEEGRQRKGETETAARERRADGVRSLRLPKGLGSRAQMKSLFDKQEIHTFPQIQDAQRGSRLGQKARVLSSMSTSKSLIEGEAGGWLWSLEKGLE